MSAEALKVEVLTLAGYLAPSEAMTAEDAKRGLAHTVAHICADKSVSPVVMALIAVELASYIDSKQRMVYGEAGLQPLQP